MKLREFLDLEENQHMSDADWARLLGFTRGYMSQLAAGNRYPSLKNALNIDRITNSMVTPYDWY